MPCFISSVSDTAHATLRWYSSWFLVGAWIPIVACYSLWIYYTCTGQIRPSGGALGHAHIVGVDCPACGLDHSRDLNDDPFDRHGNVRF